MQNSLEEELKVDWMSLTIAEMFEKMSKLNVGLSSHVIRDKDGHPLSAVILVHGNPETFEVLEAVEDASADW